MYGASHEANPATDAAGKHPAAWRQRHARTRGEPQSSRRWPITGDLPAYLERQRAAARGLQKSLEGGDYDSIGVLGHRLKGSGSGYGLDRLSQIGAALEQAANARDD